MSTVLITGTSGFIGSALAESMASHHNVVCLSRQSTDVAGVTAIQGDFTSPEQLTALDPYDIDVLVHLAAVTGGCKEEEGLRVNVLGTFNLLRYLTEQGCQKFILASSIAAIGFQSTKFRPRQIPIPDEHPCLDRDGYGVSKYLMEEVTRYLSRQNESLDFINFRLVSIIADDSDLPPAEPGPLKEWAIGRISCMYRSDAVRLFGIAVEAPLKPGVRIMNACAPQAHVAQPIPDILRAWYSEDADKLDMSWYERPGHEKDALFTLQRVKDELGFVAENIVTE